VGSGLVVPARGRYGGYSLLYPAVMGIPLSLFGPSTGLAVVKVVQAAVMSSVAVVVFAWGRQVIADVWALVAAGLTLCIPGIAYSGMLMTETLFFPLVAVALWALWRVLIQPSLARQAVFLGACALAVLTRVQALALLPAALLAIGLYCVFRRDVSVVRRLAPLLSLIVGGGIVALALSRLSGGRVHVVGVYAAATGGYEVGSSARDVFWHTGAVFVIVAGVPLIALGVLVAECARGGRVGHRGRLGRDGICLDCGLASRGRNVRVEVGRPHRRTGPDHGRAAALPRVRALARARNPSPATPDSDDRDGRGGTRDPPAGLTVCNAGVGTRRVLVHPALASPRGDVFGIA